MIRYSKTAAKSGAFTVRLGQFPEEVVAQINEAPGNKQPASDIWKGVLAATSHRYEVMILEADWTAYEEQSRSSEPAPKKKSKLGRPEKNWKDLCVIIGAYILKHHRVSPEDKIKVELASEKIHKIAEDDRSIRSAVSAVNQGCPFKHSVESGSNFNQLGFYALYLFTRARQCLKRSAPSTKELNMPSKLKNVLAFAKLGISILPLAPERLEPAVGWGAKAAVTDPKTLRAFYKKHAEYNYGLVMEGGTFAIRANDKRARLRLQTLSGGSLPKTVTFRSGPFRFYVLRSGDMQVSSSEGQLGKGLDVLGEGSCVLGPGSRMSSGAECCFAEGRALGDVQIATSPEWLSNMIGVASAPARSNPYQPGTQVVVSLPITAIFVDPKHHVDPEDVDLVDGSIGVLGLRLLSR